MVSSCQISCADAGIGQNYATTPVAGITIQGGDKWITFIRNAALSAA